MAPVLDIGIIDLYAAAFGPGFLLSGMYILYTLVRCYWNPKLGPPVPKEDRPASIKPVLWECLVGLVPVTVQGAAHGALGLDVSANLSQSAFALTGTPYARAYVTASVGVGTSGISGCPGLWRKMLPMSLD